MRYGKLIKILEEQVITRKAYDLDHMPMQKLFFIKEHMQSEIDTIFLGDSVSERVSDFDNDKRTLHELLMDIGKFKSAYCISHSAYNIELYLLIVYVLHAINIKVNRVIVNLNIRSFSPQWMQNPVFKCQPHIDELMGDLPSIRGELNELISAGSLGVVEYLNYKVDYPLSSFANIGEFLKVVNSRPFFASTREKRLRMIFMYHYLFRLEKNNSRLMLWKKLTEVCSDFGIKLIVYVNPINYEKIVECFGVAGSDIIEYNMSIVRKLFEEMMQRKTSSGNIVVDGGAVKLVNCIKEIPSEGFFHVNESTEHLSQTGRLSLSELLISNID